MPGRSIGLLFQGWSRGNPASIPNYTICRLGSNPRSRGVYRVAYDPDAEALGSSALARGLRGLPLQPGPQDRIIPARAGFTDQCGARLLLPRDHPRSRGVYNTTIIRVEGNDGSSPLARGLRGATRRASGRVRIIPARAGFTGRRPSMLLAWSDHPRSRGVYGISAAERRCVAGSSPLARGLRGRRIRPRPSGADHPRSRGVYTSTGTRPSSAGGSSPLARGLRVIDMDAAADSGIIPARAGFTPGGCPPRWSGRDHPRSRGVYDEDGDDAIPVGRSSPLARGLPPTGTGRSSRSGIIPARAGFTSGTRSRRP